MIFNYHLVKKDVEMSTPEEDTNPLEEMFDQLSKLLSFMQEKAFTPEEQIKIPSGIEKKLQKLEQDMKLFKSLSDEIVMLSNVSKEDIQKRQEGLDLDDLPPAGRRLMEKGKRVQEQAERLRQTLGLPVENLELEDTTPKAFPQRPPQEKIVDDKTFRKRRRRKFKQFGD